VSYTAIYRPPPARQSGRRRSYGRRTAETRYPGVLRRREDPRTVPQRVLHQTTVEPRLSQERNHLADRGDDEDHVEGAGLSEDERLRRRRTRYHRRQDGAATAVRVCEDMVIF